MYVLRAIFAALIYVISAGAAAQSSEDKVAQGGSTLVFSASPRENDAESRAIYDPVAAYLSKALGRHVVYEYPGSWGIYQTNMRSGHYGIVFDGPHFVGWRIEHLQHNVIAKGSGERVYVVFVKAESHINKLDQLIGRMLCTPAPPNLATLVVQSAFTNPSRLPIIRNVGGWKENYQGLMADTCVAGVATDKTIGKLDKQNLTRVIHSSSGLPELAFSAGPLLSADEQRRLREALLAPAASEPTAKLREKNGLGATFEAADNQEYRKIGALLKTEWGWY
jgi:ABC-type phosphate/phosphonate transport system substrate-binding protein